MPSPSALPSRYEAQELLGRGAMGAVWRVHDRERGLDLALKLSELPAEDAAGRFLFEQEFRTMAALAHPQLVAAHDFGQSAEGQPYFTMGLVAGQDLEACLPQAPDRVLAWLPSLTAALAFLHGRGYVHGDVKPANVRLRGEDDAVLMDLGLLRRAGSHGGPLRGTPAYMAPEAISGGAVDARADLYALGVMLYELLSGKKPFEHAEPLALLHAHLHQAPAPLQTGVPALDAAVLRLLAKAPASRFASAAELAAALDLPRPAGTQGALFGSPVVGREGVLSAAEGAPVTCLVGPGGAGKTRLLETLRAEAQLAGRATLMAGGQGQDAPPYQALAPWLRAIATAAPSEVVSRVGPYAARLLPALPVVAAPPLEGARERARAHAALADLAAAAFPGPTTWLLDDLDRLDDASRSLLNDLMRAGPGWQWRLAGSAAFDGAATVAVGALDEDQVLALAGHLLGATPPPEVAEALALADALPGTIEGLLRLWAGDALVREPGGWRVVRPLALPQGLAGALEARVAALGPEAAALARAAAVLGDRGPLPMLQALEVCSDVHAALRALADAGLLRLEDAGYIFVRDAEAAALREGQDGRALHGAAARWWEAHGGGTLADEVAIARHRMRGPEPESGLPRALAAARRALSLHAAGLAEALAREALAIAPADAAMQALRADALRVQASLDAAREAYERLFADPSLAQAAAFLPARIGQGIVAMSQGRYDEAGPILAAAAVQADLHGLNDQAVRARLFLGRVAVFSGRTAAAVTHLGAAVRLARAGLDAHPAEATAQLASCLALYGYALFAADPANAERSLAHMTEAIERARAIGDLHHEQDGLGQLGNLLLSLARYAEARDAFAAANAVATRMGSANEQLMTEVNLAAAQVELGDLANAARTIEPALAKSRAQGRKFLEGYMLALDGQVAALAGRPAAGLATIEAGLAMADRIANRYLALNIRLHQVSALIHVGALVDASQALIEARDLAMRTGNREFDVLLRRLALELALASGEEPHELPLTWDLAAFLASAPAAHKAQVLRWLAWNRWMAHDPSAATGACAEARALAEACGLVALHAETTWLAGELALEAGNGDEAVTLFGDARLLADRAGVAITSILALAAGGRMAGDRLTQREARRRLAAVLADLSASARAAYLGFGERAALMAASDGAAVALERVALLGELAAIVAGSHDMQDLLQRALEAMCELAGTQRGCVVLYEGFQEVQRVGVGFEGSADFSTTLAEEVVWTRRPVVVSDVTADARFEASASMHALEVRSAAGVPLLDGEEVVGVMIADSNDISHQWSSADVEVAAALGRLVGQAVQQARRRADADQLLQQRELALDFATALLGAGDRQAVVAAAAGWLKARTGAERAFLVLPAGERVLHPDGREGPLEEASTSLVAWASRDRQPAVIVDVERDAAQASRSVMALGLRTVVALPALDGDACHGVLYADSHHLMTLDAATEASLPRLATLLGRALGVVGPRMG